MGKNKNNQPIWNTRIKKEKTNLPRKKLNLNQKLSQARRKMMMSAQKKESPICYLNWIIKTSTTSINELC